MATILLAPTLDPGPHQPSALTPPTLSLTSLPRIVHHAVVSTIQDKNPTDHSSIKTSSSLSHTNPKTRSLLLVQPTKYKCFMRHVFLESRLRPSLLHRYVKNSKRLRKEFQHPGTEHFHNSLIIKTLEPKLKSVRIFYTFPADEGSGPHIAHCNNTPCSELSFGEHYAASCSIPSSLRRIRRTFRSGCRMRFRARVTFIRWPIPNRLLTHS